MTSQQATFAAGCFWSVELAFQRVPGVVKTTVGYTQGNTENPTYQDVCSGRTNHVEAVLVEYDPKGNDVGTQYRSGIYYHNPEQEQTAKASLQAEQKRIGAKIATEILPAAEFYRAEEYHQQYLEKGGSGGVKQSAAKGCTDSIRCYG